MHRNYLLDIYPLIAECCLLELIYYYCELRSGGGERSWAEGSDQDSQQTARNHCHAEKSRAKSERSARVLSTQSERR